MKNKEFKFCGQKALNTNSWKVVQQSRLLCSIKFLTARLWTLPYPGFFILIS